MATTTPFMKALLILFTIMLALLSSCSTVHFTQPQPANFPNEKVFGTTIRGIYTGRDKGQNYYITIDSVSVNFSQDYADSFLKSEMDSKYSLINDRVLLRNSFQQESFVPTYRNDSIFIKGRLTNLDLTLSDSILLRNHNGYCFISMLGQPNQWDVYSLRTTGRYLRVGIVDPDKAAHTIGKTISKYEISMSAVSHGDHEKHAKDDSLRHFVLSPTPMEFERFVKKGGFTEYKVKRFK